MPTVLLSGPNFRYQREASNVIVSYRGNSPVFIDVGPVAVTVRVGYGGSLMAVERPPAETPLSETPSPEQTFLVVYSERSSVLVTNREDTHVFRWGEVQIGECSRNLLVHRVPIPYEYYDQLTLM